MKCKKCDKKNPEGSKFCASCGANLSEKILFEHQDLYDKITSHLEFIGYEIGKSEEIDDGNVDHLEKRFGYGANEIKITINKTGWSSKVNVFEERKRYSEMMASNSIPIRNTFDLNLLSPTEAESIIAETIDGTTDDKKEKIRQWWESIKPNLSKQWELSRSTKSEKWSLSGKKSFDFFKP